MTTDYFGNKTAVDFAIENYQYDTVEYLIKKGTKLKSALKFTDSTDVLRAAIQTENIKLIQLILSDGYVFDGQGKIVH